MSKRDQTLAGQRDEAAGERRPTVLVGGLEVEPVSRELFDFLYEGLRNARRRFETEEDAGRGGVVQALETIILFLVIFEPVRAGGMLFPLISLCNALSALEDNNVLPLLKPKRRSAPSPSSDAYNALKGNAVFTVRRLIAMGMTPLQARKAVAHTLTEAGVRPARRGAYGGTQSVTERTIRKWQEDINADVGFRTTAAQSLRAKETAHLLDFFSPFGLDQRLKLSASSFGFRLDAADWPDISVSFVRQAQAQIDAILRERAASDLVRIRQDYLDSMVKLVAATRAVETT